MVREVALFQDHCCPTYTLESVLNKTSYHWLGLAACAVQPTYMGTEVRPESEKECWCLRVSKSARSHDVSRGSEGMVNAIVDDPSSVTRNAFRNV